jgi:hypothetical protein
LVGFTNGSTSFIIVLHLVIVVDFSTNLFFHSIGNVLKFFLNLYVIAANLVLMYFFSLKHSNTTTIFFQKNRKLYNIGVQVEDDDVFSIPLWRRHSSLMELYHREDPTRSTILLGRA